MGGRGRGGRRVAVIDSPAAVRCENSQMMTEGAPGLFHCPLVALKRICSTMKENSLPAASVPAQGLLRSDGFSILTAAGDGKERRHKRR